MPYGIDLGKIPLNLSQVLLEFQARENLLGGLSIVKPDPLSLSCQPPAYFHVKTCQL